MSTGVQKGLQILLTLVIFLFIMRIVFNIVGVGGDGGSTELVSKFVNLLSLQFVGN